MEFKAGKVHKTFQTKSGKACVIRWTKWDDLQQLTDFINKIAQEDAFLPYSPIDKETLESESKFLASALTDGSTKKGSFVVAEVDGRIVGASDVRTQTRSRDRSKHVVVFGIIISKKYRGEGIGGHLITTVLDHAENFLEGIKLVTLTAFAENEPAVNLYKKHGFVEVGKIPNALYRKNSYSDEIIMIKELPA